METIDFITSGKLKNNQIFTYRTKDGSAYYQFSYHKKLLKGYYEIDIHLQPSYEGKEDNVFVTHKLSSPRDTKHKICISSRHEPKTLDKAQKISMEWAELTNTYIKTGVTIDDQIANKD